MAPEAAAVPRFAVTGFEWEGERCLAAGTGYTGEDGVECAVPADGGRRLLSTPCSAAGVGPAGLGARDTLRLEAGLPLHGHELGPGITPLQAGLGWVVGWDKGDFRGRAALVAERAAGPRRRLRGPAWPTGASPPVRARRSPLVRRSVGTVTSGNFSPMLGHGIALALVDTAARVDRRARR